MTGAANGHPRDRLSEYLDDELDIEAREAIDRHLAVCEDCRAELEAIRRLKKAVATEQVPPVPVDLAARIGRTLDAATPAPPRARRFVIPATIAATIGAISLLVVLQWRPERLAAPHVPAPQKQAQEIKLKEAPARDALEKDSKQRDEPAAAPESLKPKEEAAPSGVAGDAAGALAGGAAPQLAAPDARSDRERASAPSENAARAERDFKAIVTPAPSAPAAKAQAVSDCVDRWSDSGLRATWEVPDAAVAARQLGRIARDVGGIGVWRGVDDGRPYELIVPRSRFEEVFYALRARGVAGLAPPPAIAEGDDCTGIAIALTVVTEQASPPR